MNAWTGLLRKEFRLSLAGHIVGLIILCIIFAFAYIASVRIGEPGIVLVVSAMAIGSHLFYLPAHVFTSLKTEGKQLQLWLHNPQSGMKLFSAKIIVSFLALLVSLAVSLLITYFGLNQSFNGSSIYEQIMSYHNFDFLFSMGFWALLHLIALSVYLTVWVIFIWTIYNLFKSKIGKLSWLVALLAFVIPNWLFAKLQETQLYSWLTNWGQIKISFLEGARFAMQDMTYVYFGDYVIHLVIAVGLFVLSAWLIDNKVEV